MREKIIGVLLAGGMSRRFGRPKAFAEIDGRRFYDISLEALLPISDEEILITNKTLEADFQQVSGITVTTDTEKHAGKGPLAGIYTAMEQREAAWYAVLPTDVPFITHNVFERLFKEKEEGTQAIIPLVNDRIQPLIGFYHISLKPIIKTLLDEDKLKMKALLDEANVKFVRFNEETPFININRQVDYDRHIRTGIEGSKDA